METLNGRYSLCSLLVSTSSLLTITSSTRETDMLDFEGMLRRELDWQRLVAKELDGELLLYAHFKGDQEFLKACGIECPQRSESCSP